ncbi:MAG: group II intron reverse transcriptase/maturase [Acidobacteriota bacterium]
MKGKLFPKICDIRTLWQAWRRVKEKGSKGGIDRITLESFEKNLDRNLQSLGISLERETYIPEPVKRIYIPKHDKPEEKRIIALPSIKDKIVQEAVKIVIEPLFEHIFLDCSYGYRPGKGPQKAIQKVEEYIKEGRTWAFSCDIDNFFDSIDHNLLISLFSRRIWEKSILRLVELWLKMGVIDRGVWTDVGEGIPQGNVLSPLLSNVYLHPFDQEMTKRGYSLIRYADNFTVLGKSRAEAVEAFKDAQIFLQNQLFLRLNFENIPIRSIQDGFIFLGFLFKDKRKAIADSKILKIQEKIKQILRDHAISAMDELVVDLNESIEGWKRYYMVGDVKTQFQFLDNFLFYNLSVFLKRKQEFKDRIDELRSSLNKMEFFIEKSAEEKKKFLEFLIARSGIKKIPEKSVSIMQEEDKTPLSVERVVEKKKKEYEKILSKETEILISEPGSFLGKTSRRVVVKLKGKRVLEMPFFRLKNIIILSQGVALSSNLIKFCSENEIPIHFLDSYGKPYAQIYSPRFPLFRVSAQQLIASRNEKGLRLAISFVKAKIKNQISLLKYYNKYKKRKEIAFLNQCSESIKKMTSLLEELKILSKENDFEKVRLKLFALEGQSASHYWNLIRNLLSSEVYFEGRERKGATDLVNSLLNYGYGVLYSRIFEAIILAGLNPNISFLHKEQIGKPTLVFDLIEEFRQPVVDKAVIKMIRRKEKLEMDGTELTQETRKRLVEEILKRLNSKIKFQGKILTLLEIIKYQADSIAKFLENKVFYKPFVDKW